MDIGHAILAAVVVVVAIWAVRRRRRELHIRIDWKDSPDGDPADRN